MKRIKKIKNKQRLHPIFSYCLLIFVIIVLSGILNLFNVTTTYNKISNNGTYVRELVSSQNLLSLHGLKLIFSNTVSNFASFTPLSMLIITLIGIGIMDKTGFLDSLFYILTKKTNKKVVTFILSLVCILSSITGDLSFIVFIPLSALLFKYGKRHPKAGIICSFASIACGYGINIFLSSVDSSLILYTNQAANLLSKDYNVGVFSFLVVMIIASIILALIVSNITEKVIVPKLGHYELLTETEDYLTKKEKKGLLISLFFGIIYIIIIIYNIIPYAPLGGNFLDYSQNYYIDKLFGYNSFFSQGYVFVVVILFFILGFSYGVVTKKIRSAKDLFDSLCYSLDRVGNVLVYLFFASTLIFIFKASNIGTLITAHFANIINSSSFSGIVLVFITFIFSALSTIVLPGSVSKWAILSPSIVPMFMNEGLTPEFATLIFRAGECVTYGITPFMAYFIIYLAFMELYNNDNESVGLYGNIKYLIPYSISVLLMWVVLLLLFYVTGIPFGIGGYVGL